MAWNNLVTPGLTATPDRATAYPVSVDGEQYYQQIFTVTSGTWAYDQLINVALAGNAPIGTKITDLNNQAMYCNEIGWIWAVR